MPLFHRHIAESSIFSHIINLDMRLCVGSVMQGHKCTFGQYWYYQSVFIKLAEIVSTSIGGDPGGGGRVPPRIFLGDRPPSNFESLTNIYSYICILNTIKVIQSV